MTKKQIEALKNWFIVQVNMNQEQPEKITAAMRYLHEMLEMLFMTYLIEDYKEIDRINREVIQAGRDEMQRIKAEKTA